MTTLHFIHTGKTGGTAMKRGLRQAGFAFWEADLKTGKDRDMAVTPYGRIQLHHHSFRITDVPPEDYFFFCLRDPIARFLSGFYSRLDKGQPRYYFEWTEAERIAFEAFPTPQSLAAALAGGDAAERERAEWAMRNIRHLGFMTRSVGRPKAIRQLSDRLVYVARQETLGDDWERLKEILGIPAEAKLPRAHEGNASRDKTLDETAVRALRQWYRRDYRLLAFCDELRRSRGWVERPRSRGRLASAARLLRLQAAR
jgi:hypothetical protein